jgi:hypothetical protein
MVRLLGLRPTAKLVSRRLFPHPHQAVMRQRVVDVLGAQPPPPASPRLARWRTGSRWIAQAHAGKLLPTLLAASHDYTLLAEKQALARIGADLRGVEGSRQGTSFDAIQATNTAALE